jgi:phosphoribosyl-AMP cyclohydrolase
LENFNINHLVFNSDGLIPTIAQEKSTNEIEMTVKTKKAHFWSRSKKKLWLKGETSGNKLNIINIYTDCDSDALIYEVELEGIGACHTGKKSCFYKKLEL